MVVVGITGKKGSGKSTAAKEFEKFGFQVLNFADPLKEAAAVLLNVEERGEKLNKFFNEKKEVKIPGFNTTYREFLQLMGTDFVREMVDKNFWTEIVRQKMLKSHDGLFVIGDVRFNNECNFIKELGGVTILIERPSISKIKDSHKSENGVDGGWITYKIVNDKSLDIFKKEVEKIIHLL